MPCFQLSSTGLATLLANGYTLLGGPFPTQAACLANCPAGGAVTVTQETTSLLTSDASGASLTIYGTGFVSPASGNVVTLYDAAGNQISNTVGSGTATSLVLTLTSPLSTLGAITAVVTNSTGTSGPNSVQVATVVSDGGSPPKMSGAVTLCGQEVVFEIFCYSNGDDNTTVLAWAKATGLPTTAQYGPYQGEAGSCKSGMTLYKIQDWGYCTPSNTNAPAAVNDIKAAMMEYGPIGCGIDASSDAFGNYTTGIFVSAPSSNIDHDIVLVGWQDGTVSDGSGGYWILRNSWGTSWGQQGYMFISYGSAGVGWEAVWVVAAGPPAPPAPPAGASYTLTPTTTPAAGTYSLAVTADGSITLTPVATPSSGITGVTATTTVQQLMDAANAAKKGVGCKGAGAAGLDRRAPQRPSLYRARRPSACPQDLSGSPG